ncbi:MAG: hypothetical protein HY716_01870 [Planctomycetes bacterium]|nr:hypothetical protein [Planctomycetota bacterium]
MAAVYRVAVQGWGREQALNEMRDGGYGFDAPWEEVRRHFYSLDFDRLRRDAGLNHVPE